MKSIAFLLLLFGIIFIVIGYIRNENKIDKKKIIEYRYIPYSLYSEQINKQNLLNLYKNMFNKKDVI